MFKKTLFAATAAALISAGSLGASTTSASAAWHGNGYNGGGYGGASVGFGNNGWFFNFGYAQPAPQPVRPRPVVRPVPVQQVCSPTYKTVTVWDPYYGWVYRTVPAGQTCNYVPVYPAYRGW